MKNVLLLCCCMIIARSGTAQDTTHRSIGGYFTYHPYDFFTGVQFSSRPHLFEYRLQAGVGMVRTFFQGRIYPGISAQVSHDLLNYRSKLQTGPLLRTAVSMLNLERHSGHNWHQYEELFVGGFVGMDTRINWRLSAGFGPALEQMWINSAEERRSYFSWNSFVELSCGYAF